jgi:putative tricarboxylic transport membrane protein
MSVLQKSVTSAALALLCGGVLLLGTGNASAEVSFKGKTIDVIIGSTPGGGTDGTTRLVGEFLEKYLPGHPTMRYRNIPGGHGTKGLNYFAKVKPDGLTWAGGASSHVDPNALRKSVVQYDPTKFHFIGGIMRGGSVVFMRKEKLPNLTDPSKPPVIVGVLDGNRSWAQMIQWGGDILHWNVRFVVGYPGTSFLYLATRRGEIDMMGDANVALLDEMFKTGDIVGIAQIGTETEPGQFEKRSSFPNIPIFASLVKGKVSGVAAQAFDFWSALNNVDKWYALPPGTPKEIEDTYRAAWAKMVKDPNFIKRGEAQFSSDFTPISGVAQADEVDKTAYPQNNVTAFMESLKKKYNLPTEPLSDAELAALAKAKGLDKMDVPAVKAKLISVGNGGREIEFPAKGKNVKLKVSSSRTKVSIGGQKAARADLKAGMECSITFPDGAQQANEIACQ